MPMILLKHLTGHEAPALTAGPVVSGVWCDLAYEDLPKTKL